jgi:hypothetical protein
MPALVGQRIASISARDNAWTISGFAASATSSGQVKTTCPR